MSKEDFGDWLEQSESKINEKLDGLKGKQFKEIREKIMTRFREACESGNTKIIQKAIVEIREELEEITSHKEKGEVKSNKDDVKNTSRNLPWTEQVKDKSPEELIYLFEGLGFTAEQWQSGEWMRNNGFEGLRKALAKRFSSSWKDFLQFMGIEKGWARRVKDKSPEELLSLFGELKLTQEEWQSSAWLAKNSFSGLRVALLERFNSSWNEFLRFMGLNARTWNERVKDKSQKELLSLFKELKLVQVQWQSSFWLNNNGFSGLRLALFERFNFSWNKFLKFMDIKVELPWHERVKNKSAEELLSLFGEIGLAVEQWRNIDWLKENGFSGLCSALTGRFNSSWKDFLDFMDIDDIKSNEDIEKLSGLKLEEVIAFYRGQPGGEMKLKIYLQFAHPELTEVEINKLVIRSFKELYGTSGKKEEEYLKWETKLKAPLLSVDPPEQTKKNTITLTGCALGSQDIYVSGAWTRRVKIQPDGTFSVTIPLRIGQRNEIRIMGIDRGKKIRSEQDTFEVMQKGKPEDVESLIRLLEALGEDLTNQISEDPGRQEFLAECTERLLIKKFSKSFEDGQEYVQKLLEKTTHPALNRIIKRVLQNFEWIEGSSLPNVKEKELLFFQKFCAYKIRQAMNTPGRQGVNICNDPGLGKTRTVHAAIADQEAVIFSPNSVVTAWKREAEKSLINPDLLVLHNMDHKERKKALKDNRNKRIVTNLQFLQNTEDKERFTLIGGERKVAVFDEAHSRKNQHSEQSKGAKMVPHRFAINVTATLARNPTELRRMLLTLDPEKKEFQSDQAFQRAFPSTDPDALRQLKLIVDQYTIRFRKHDVMEEIDPNLPLEDQLHRLPGKERVAPDALGKFDMTEKQAKAIYEMFKDWETWCRKYDKYIPKDEMARQDGLRKQSGLSKLHAYRQIINNPSYINDRSGEDPKLDQNMRIIRKSLREGRKIVIFCLYEAQAQKYARVLSKYHPSLYTGQTSDKGLVKDEKTGKPKLFSLDEKGLPIEDPEGEPMTTLDYEWQTFQSEPERKILISTYSAGSVGTTFTAGKTTIYDDLPRDCKEDIQAEDRTHRIDPDHQTHATVQYYQMQARYPERFLEQMKKTWVVKDPETKVFEEFKKQEDAVRYAKTLETDDTGPIDVTTAYDRFFAQGTYDQVHSQNLLNQRTMFHLINDGIADEAELKKEDIPFAGLENGKTEEVLERDRDAE